MKVDRQGNVVVIRVDQEDCPPGFTTEMLADLLVQSIESTRPVLIKRGNATKEEVDSAVEKCLKDFNERWEIT